MNRPMLLVMAALLAIISGGCSGNTQLPLPPAMERAVSHNRRGLLAESKGESQRALHEFNLALRQYGAIEYSDGIVVSLVNISRVQRHLDDPARAMQAIDRALPLVTPQSPLYAEVAFEKAQTSILAGDPATADVWAGRGVTDEKGNRTARGVNLLARTRFLRGAVPEAEPLALEALRLAKEKETRAEEANALRLLGEVKETEKRPGAAAGYFSQALAIDKELGLSRKIAGDLQGLARQAAVRNEPAQALAYFQRALDVSLDNGDLAAGAEILGKMADIHAGRGETERAAGLRAEGETLMKNQTKPIRGGKP